MPICEICHKINIKNIKAHQRLAHPAKGLPQKSEDEIAGIIYNDVVKVICGEYGLKVEEWAVIDKESYLAVAKRILGKEG